MALNTPRSQSTGRGNAGEMGAIEGFMYRREVTRSLSWNPKVSCISGIE